MSLISNEVALKKLICKCSFLSFLLVCLFVFSSSFSFFQLFRFPLIWLMLRFKLKMNFHRGIAQTVCDVEYVTEPIRSLELRGFQPSTRRDQSGQKKMEITWNYMRDMLEKVKDTFSASLSRVFALVSILLYAMLLYVAICCYLFYLFIPERTRHDTKNSLKELATSFFSEILREKVKDTQVHEINWFTFWTAGTKLRNTSPDHFHHDVLGCLIEGTYLLRVAFTLRNATCSSNRMDTQPGTKFEKGESFILPTLLLQAQGQWSLRGWHDTCTPVCNFSRKNEWHYALLNPHLTDHDSTAGIKITRDSLLYVKSSHWWLGIWCICEHAAGSGSYSDKTLYGMRSIGTKKT